MSPEHEITHVEEDLTLFLEEELPEDRRREVQAHLASCERCARALGETERLKEVLQVWDDPRPSAGLFRSIQEQTQRKAKAYWLNWQLVGRIALRLVGVVLIVGLTLLVEHRWVRTSGSDQAAPEALQRLLKEHTRVAEPATLVHSTSPTVGTPDDAVYSEYLQMFPGLVQIQQQILLSREVQRRSLPSFPELPADRLIPLARAQQEMPFRIVAPPYLHPGYILEAVYRVGEREGLHLVYTDGLTTVSLFEQAHKEPNGLKADELRLYALLRNRGSEEASIFVWRNSETALALIGDLPTPQMMRLVEVLQSESLPSVHSS